MATSRSCFSPGISTQKTPRGPPSRQTACPAAHRLPPNAPASAARPTRSKRRRADREAKQHAPRAPASVNWSPPAPAHALPAPSEMATKTRSWWRSPQRHAPPVRRPLPGNPAALFSTPAPDWRLSPRDTAPGMREKRACSIRIPQRGTVVGFATGCDGCHEVSLPRATPNGEAAILFDRERKPS